MLVLLLLPHPGISFCIDYSHPRVHRTTLTFRPSYILTVWQLSAESKGFVVFHHFKSHPRPLIGCGLTSTSVRLIIDQESGSNAKRLRKGVEFSFCRGGFASGDLALSSWCRLNGSLIRRLRERDREAEGSRNQQRNRYELDSVRTDALHIGDKTPRGTGSYWRVRRPVVNW